jgi:transposase
MLKESRYVRLANTMYRVLRNSRIPLFLHRKSNHVFTMWQHLILLTIRQYEGKSYNRMFVEWLIEAYYLRLFLGLSRIPHFTTLQKFTDRINNSLLEKIISSFIVISGTKHIFAGIDSTGFKLTRASLHSIILIEQN